MQSSTRLIIAAFLTVAIAPCLAAAQGEKLAKPETEAQTARPTPQPYILTLSVKETNGGKAILEKNFTLTVIADDTHFQRENLRDGDRIPYQSEKGQSYQDVGTNIDQRCHAAWRSAGRQAQRGKQLAGAHGKLQPWKPSPGQPLGSRRGRRSASRQTNRNLLNYRRHLRA